MATEDDELLKMKKGGNAGKKPSKMSFFSKMAEQDDELILLKAQKERSHDAAVAKRKDDCLQQLQ